MDGVSSQGVSRANERGGSPALASLSGWVGWKDAGVRADTEPSGKPTLEWECHKCPKCALLKPSPPQRMPKQSLSAALL